MSSPLSREIKSHGFILRVTASQDADVIVKILASNGEKISAFAKAGLKSRKRFGGALQPLLNINFRVTKRQGHEMGFLEETQVRHDFKNLKTEIESLMAASYAAELVEHSAQEGLENPELYNLFGAALRAFEMGLPLEGVLRQFEVKLLSLLGWLPGFQKCSECGSTDDVLSLNSDHGLVVCRNCGIFPLTLPRPLRETILSLLTSSVLKNDLKEVDARKVAPITNALLQSHWGQRKLKSTQFLMSLRRFEK